MADQQADELAVQFHPIAETREKSFTNLFTGLVEGLAKGEPGGCIMPGPYARHAANVRRFQPRSDDVWVVTFPKCGTTWMQELVWLVMHDCDTEAAMKQDLNWRSPFLEMPYFVCFDILPPSIREVSITMDMIEEMPSPRVIKSHLPFDLLHPRLLDTCKVVYVARNPKDVIVSYFYHHKLFHSLGFDGDLEAFAQYFLDDMVQYSPFFAHVLDAWNKRHHANLHFVFYEDMKKDLRGEIKKVASFLGKSYDKDQLDKVTHHLRFSSLRENATVNFEVGKSAGFMSKDHSFIRNGKTGDWKNHFSPALDERIDKWMEANLSESDLRFVTELESQGD